MVGGTLLNYAEVLAGALIVALVAPAAFKGARAAAGWYARQWRRDTK